MENQSLYFISILRDLPKFEKDLEKISKIVSSDVNLPLDTEIKMLWALSADQFDPNFDILSSAPFGFDSFSFRLKTPLDNSNRVLLVEQIICDQENPFEQLEPLSSLGVLKQKDLENLKQNRSYRPWQEGFKNLMHLNKEDSICYATERNLKGDDASLSNILISSLAEKTHPRYGTSVNFINLEGITDEQAEDFLPEIRKEQNTITADSKHIKSIKLDFSRTREKDEIQKRFERQGLEFSYKNPQLSRINHERNLRYKALRVQEQKRKSFFYRMLSPILDLFIGNKFKKSGTFKAYLQGKCLSILTAKDLIREIERKWKRSQGFFEKLTKGRAMKKIQQELIKELTKQIDEKEIPKGTNVFSYLPDMLNRLKKERTPDADYKAMARHFLRKEGKNLFASYKGGVNGKDTFGNAPLHLAAGSKEIMEILVEEHQANVNIKDAQGATPAFMTASFGKIEALKYLKEKGADLHARDENGNNILYSLVADHIPNNPRDLTQVVSYLLEQDVHPTEENDFGDAPCDRAFKNKKDLHYLFLKAYPEEVESRISLLFPISNDPSLYKQIISERERRKESSLEHSDSGYSSSSSSEENQKAIKKVRPMRRYHHENARRMTI